MHRGLIAISTLTLLLAACASKPIAPVETVPIGAAPTAAPGDSETRIDVQGLVRDQGLERAPDQLGYAEHAFNTCEAGFGYSHSHGCRVAYVMSLHVRMQCREQSEAINAALLASDLRPIEGQRLKWTIRRHTGSVDTDGNGYAQLNGVFDHSPRHERIRLQIGSQFLYMRAQDVTRIVTPPQWCESP